MTPSRSTTDVRRPRSPRGEGDSLREELLDAAEALLIRRGSMDAVSVRAIAARVGVTPPALYLHFEDKDDLFFAVCERRFADFEQVLHEAGVGIADPLERLRAMGEAYVRYGIDHGEHYEIILGPGAEDVVKDRPLEDTAGMRALALLVGTVVQAIDSGAIRAGDPWLTSLTIWSAVHGTVMLHRSREKLGSHVPMPDTQELGDEVCHVILRGLAAD